MSSRVINGITNLLLSVTFEAKKVLKFVTLQVIFSAYPCILANDIFATLAKYSPNESGHLIFALLQLLTCSLCLKCYNNQ